MRIPPLFHWVAEHYHSHPIPTVVIGLGLLILVLFLLRKAFKLFALIIVVLIALILTSYFVEGEDAARRRLEESSRRVGEVLRDSGVLGDEQQDAPAPAGEPGGGR